MSQHLANFGRRNVALLAALVALGPLAIDMYLPAMPEITAFFETDTGLVQLTLSSYLFAFALGQLVYGPLSDSFGRRAILISGLSLFVVATYLCAKSTSVEWMIFFRFMQALGGSSCAVIARAIVRDKASGKEAAIIMSVIMTVMSVAPMIAPFMGGVVLEWGHWTTIFYLLASTGFLLLSAVFLLLEESHIPKNRVSFRFKSYFNNFYIILRDPVSLGYILSGGFSFAGMFIYITATPFLFIDFFSLSEIQYGLLFGLNAFGMMLFTMLNARMLRAFDLHRVMLATLILITIASFVLVVSASYGEEAYYPVVAAIWVYISMIGPLSVNTMVGAMENFKNLAGTASSLSGASRFLFGGVAGYLLASLASERLIVFMPVFMLACALMASVSYLLLVHKKVV